MAKDKSFAAKLAKAAGTSAARCATCGELINTVHVVETVKNEAKGSYKFKEDFKPFCKCNQNDLAS